MPFLFVDYEQGAGGEKFCAGLSQSPQCEKLDFVLYSNGRTKVKDVFDQEFLKPRPRPKIVNSSSNLYTLVPTHRHTALAKTLLDNVRGIRIRMPEDAQLFQKVKEQQIKKVFLSKEPSDEYFLGYVKILTTIAKDPTFIKKINRNMNTVELRLLSLGIEPTQTNIDKYLEEIRETKLPEPDCDYDLVVPYEDLVYNTDIVAKQLKDIFDIDVKGTWLNDYANAIAAT